MSKFSSMAGDDCLMGLISLGINEGSDLIEDRDHKDCSFTHTGLGLAENILTLECERDSFDLNFAGMFETTLSDCPFEFVFQEEIVPTGKIGTLILFVGIFLGLFLIGTFILGHDIGHGPRFKTNISSNISIDLNNRLIFISDYDSFLVILQDNLHHSKLI